MHCSELIHERQLRQVVIEQVDGRVDGEARGVVPEEALHLLHVVALRLLSPIAAYRIFLNRPITPEVAGSSPIAPVLPFIAAALEGPACRRFRGDLAAAPGRIRRVTQTSGRGRKLGRASRAVAALASFALAVVLPGCGAEGAGVEAPRSNAEARPTQSVGLDGVSIELPAG